MAERTWRDVAGRVGLVLFCINLLAYLGKLLVFQALYKTRFNLLVIWEWFGLAISILAPVLAVIGMRKRFPIIVAVASVVLAYLWFSALAWWALVK